MENDLRPVDASVNDKRILKIILSVLLVFCCFVGGSVYASVYYLHYLAKEQASVSATEKVIATQDAATAQVHATATSIRHATLVAGYEIFDDFDSNPHRWYAAVENNERWSGSIFIRNGVYAWDLKEIKDPSSFSFRDYDDQKIIQNFDLSVDAKLVKGSSELLCYAVAFRVSPRSFDSGGYMFSVCDSGVYAVQYHNTIDGSEALIPWTRSPDIHSGAWNTMSVHAQEDKIVLSINNSVVEEFSDTRASSGYVYLIVRIFGDQPGTIYFDNFALQPFSK